MASSPTPDAPPRLSSGPSQAQLLGLVIVAGALALYVWFGGQ